MEYIISTFQKIVIYENFAFKYCIVRKLFVRIFLIWYSWKNVLGHRKYNPFCFHLQALIKTPHCFYNLIHSKIHYFFQGFSMRAWPTAENKHGKINYLKATKSPEDTQQDFNLYSSKAVVLNNTVFQCTMSLLKSYNLHEKYKKKYINCAVIYSFL